jgi:hypothetical protein
MERKRQIGFLRPTGVGTVRDIRAGRRGQLLRRRLPELTDDLKATELAARFVAEIAAVVKR